MPFVLTGAEDLLSVTGGHPFVRSSLRYRHQNLRGWTSRGATVWLAEDERAERDGVSVVAFGPGGSVVDLLTQVAHLLPESGSLTVPRDAAAGLPDAVGFHPRSRWEFRALSAPPPEVPGEAVVEALPVRTHPRVETLLDLANPTASARPGSPSVRLWAGIGDDTGGLVAVAADTSRRGVGHTSSVATDPAARGRGFGAAVTCWLARRQVAEFGVATLGFYADNDPARRLYDRLGYGQGIAMVSGPLSRRCSPAR
ncbi:MAG TPA: GNAT family N-acetyltransferase [Mycobacteriales bacterium]|nr:GNAT family N-acetyltransferase [Mycobacteriales bacterium]